MSITDTMTVLIERAEAGEADCIFEARDVLANALINGEPVDETKLYQLGIRVGKNARTANQSPYIFRWSALATSCADYIEHKQVAMRDGRCATEDGWDYSNCEPDRINALVSLELVDRLDAYIRTLTNAEPSNDPERNPSEYDEKHDEVVATALAAFLENKG